MPQPNARKLLSDFLIAGPVLRYLRGPEICSRLWHSEQMTVVAVPEASVHEQHRIEFGKHEVRASGKLSVMEAEAKATSMQRASDDYFRFGVF